jgi:hypothetical protein
VQVEGLGQLKNRTRDLPACSIVPQPTTLPHTSWYTCMVEVRNLYKILIGNPEVLMLCVRPWVVLRTTLRLTETGLQMVKCNELTQETFRWPAFVDTVGNLRLP